MKRTFQPKKRQRTGVHGFLTPHEVEERPQGNRRAPQQGPREARRLIRLIGGRPPHFTRQRAAA